jgi:hypothetical protein
MIAPPIFDLTGRTQPWLWLLHTFGHVEYHPATPLVGLPIYRIIRLSAGVTGQLLTATVLDEEGRPLPRARVVRAWSHGSDLPWLVPTADRPLGDYVATTDAQGLAEFPTAAADLYTFPASGRSSLWILDARTSQTGEVVPSDAISGIGILDSDLGLRLCLHITWKRMRWPPGPHPPRQGPILNRVDQRSPFGEGSAP